MASRTEIHRALRRHYKPVGLALKQACPDHTRTQAQRNWDNWCEGGAKCVTCALGEYQDGSGGINQWLTDAAAIRKSKIKSRFASDYTPIIRNLDRAIKQTTLPLDLTVYRGLTGSHQPTLKPGKVFTEKRYVSTSINKNFVEGSWSNPFDSGTILTINVPAGTPAIYMPSLLNNHYNDEWEVVLHRGLKFKVEDASSKTTSYPNSWGSDALRTTLTRATLTVVKK